MSIRQQNAVAQSLSAQMAARVDHDASARDIKYGADVPLSSDWLPSTPPPQSRLIFNTVQRCRSQLARTAEHSTSLEIATQQCQLARYECHVTAVLRYKVQQSQRCAISPLDRVLVAACAPDRQTQLRRYGELRATTNMNNSRLPQT